MRQQRDAAQLEMGIYESCVSTLPDLSQAKGDLLDCPACARQPSVSASMVPPWIRAEVDWRRQHTEVLNQRIEVLEREKLLWEQKLRKLRSNSPGTSARNKIFQLFPKEPPVASHVDDVSPPGTVHTAHAWSVGPAALKGSAREIYEKMLNPQPLQFLHPAPRPEREKLQEERAIEAERQQQQELRAQEEQVQAELGQQMANRQELRSALQRELQSMRCLEAERLRQREATRAKLQDELHQNLREERRAWQVEQERQDLQRREAHRKRTEVHQEMQRLELERLIDKLSLKRSCQPEQPASFNEEKLLELWKLRLAKDPQEPKEPSKELQVCDDLPAELLGIEEWLLFYGDLLNGTSRDKLLDTEVLEHAFLLVSNSQPTLEPQHLHAAADLTTPGVVMMMLSYWLQHCQATWQSCKEAAALSLPGVDDPVPSMLPVDSVALQQPFDELTLSSTRPEENRSPTDHIQRANTGADADARKPMKNKQAAWASDSLSQASLTADQRTEVDAPGPLQADGAHAELLKDHSRNSEERGPIQGQLGDTVELAHSGHDAFLTRGIPARHVSDSSVVVKEGITWQQTRASLDSSLPMQRHDGVPRSEEIADQSKPAPAHPAKVAAGDERTSVAGGGQQPARPCRASVPEDSKQKAHRALVDDAQTPAPDQRVSVAVTGQEVSGFAKPSRASVSEDGKHRADWSEEAPADTAKGVAEDQRTSVASGGRHQDEDGWGSDGWNSARHSQASVPEDSSNKAASQSQISPAEDARASAAEQVVSLPTGGEHQLGLTERSRGREAAVATQHASVDHSSDEEASEEEVFTKEQWTEWFKTADLEEAELLLLLNALQHLLPEQQLSPQEMAEALRAYRATVSGEDADQLQEWAQWALEINDSD